MFIRKSSVALVSFAMAGAGMLTLASPAHAAVIIDCNVGASPAPITGAGPFEFDQGSPYCRGYNVRTTIASSDISIAEDRTGSGGWVTMPNAVVLNAGGPSGENANEGLQITVAPGASGTVYVDFYENQYNTLAVTYTITIGGGGGTPAPVISSVSPASGTDAGGTSVTIIGTDLTGATAVTFGGTAATSFNVDDSTKITATTPAGTPGAVDVAVTTPGGDDTSVGAFTYTAAPAPDPTPAPANPPSAPVAPELAPGDGEVTVSWDAPATQGSFPVTDYQVQSVPGSVGCLVPATQTQCTIGSLTNGTTYEFMVRALNGGGWGPWLDAGIVTPVTPVEASIMITGSRGDVRGRPGVLATGSTFGISQGSVLHPWIRLPEHARPTEGKARITLDASGDFTWQRRTGKPIEVHICTSDRSVCSEEITIAVR